MMPPTYTYETDLRPPPARRYTAARWCLIWTYPRCHPYITLAHFWTFSDTPTKCQQKKYWISAKIDVFVTPPTHLPTQFFCRRDLEMVPYTDQKISLSINTMHNTLVHNGVQNYYKVTFVRLSFTNKFIIISSNCLEIGQFWSSISSIQT